MLTILASLSPGFAFVGLVISQIVLLRTQLKLQIMRSFLVSFRIGLLIIVVLEYLAGHSSFVDYLSYLLLSVATYTLIAFGYLSFLGMGISLRVRLLYYLSTQKHALTPSQLYDGFNAGQLQEIRVQRAVDGGSIIRRGGKLFIGPSRTVVFLARINVILKRILTGKSSEFETLPHQSD